MKKNLIVLTLALLIALPVFGFASAELTATTPPEAQTDPAATAAPDAQPDLTAPFGMQKGRRWNQNPIVPEQTAPQTGWVDANGDGVCDNCGNEQGKNTEAPNFIDENKDGVCDHFGTDQQGQGKGFMQGMRSRMQQILGRGQGMMGRMQQGQGVQGQQGQCSNYVDANNDGVCDNLAQGGQQQFGRGRHHR